VSSEDLTNFKAVKILVIDDDPGDFYVIRKVIEGIQNFKAVVKWATSYEEGKSLITEFGDDFFDVILVDYSLGTKTGVDFINELIDRIRAPFVVMTGSDDYETDMLALKSGAYDFLVKSEITSKQLERSIRYSVERKSSEIRIREAYLKLEKMVESDMLTGMLNTRGLRKALVHEQQRARRSGGEPHVVFVDLDDFKAINDRFGRSVGDVVIKDAAQKILETIRPSDHAARIAADQFMLILSDIRLAEAQHVAERLRSSLARSPIELVNGHVKVTATIAVLSVDVDVLSLDMLLDDLQYSIKKSKDVCRNKIIFPGRESALSGDENISDVLRQMVDGSGLRALSQSIVQLSDESVVGYEMLTRGVKGPFEMPDVFFKLSMENEVLTRVDLACVKKALEISRKFDQKLTIHINMFPSTILSSSTRKIIELFQNYKNDLCIEISEQQIIGDPSYLLEAIRQFRQSGILISLDDVGFGKSCLESLIFLEPDIIKLDKKCVMNVSKKKEKLPYLKRMIKVAKCVSKDIIAEGIETREDLEVLNDLEVPYGQGYFFSRPS
jgi:diguanylate cyclase (GGDEF)-like protein